MYINFWYPAEQSSHLNEQPIHRKMLGQDFVLFRDSNGIARCMNNVCVHRGGSLAHGKVRGDCIECPYHGWQFDAEGKCQHVPSLEPGSNIPSRAKVDAYPTQEKYGQVFVFLGDLPAAERPPVLTIPEWEDDKWRATCQVMEWPVNSQRSIENSIDTAHNEFVHTTHIGVEEGENYVPSFTLTETEWGLELDYVAPGGAMNSNGFVGGVVAESKEASEAKSNKPETNMHLIQHGPATAVACIQPTPGINIHAYLFETPIDEKNTRLTMISLRNFLLDEDSDEMANEVSLFVANEDLVVLEKLRPAITPMSNAKELLVPADAPIAHYRQHLKQWQDRGWKIDSAAIMQSEDDTTYAIPSPARRLQRGWIIDPIPLKPAKTTQCSEVQAPSMEIAANVIA